MMPDDGLRNCAFNAIFLGAGWPPSVPIMSPLGIADPSGERSNTLIFVRALFDGIERLEE